MEGRLCRDTWRVGVEAHGYQPPPVAWQWCKSLFIGVANHDCNESCSFMLECLEVVYIWHVAMSCVDCAKVFVINFSNDETREE